MAVVPMYRARAARAPEVADVIHRRLGITSQMQQRIDQHRAVPGRKHETVTVWPFGCRRVKFQKAREQYCCNISHAHWHAGVAAVGCLDSVHRKSADGVGHGAQAGSIERHQKSSGRIGGKRDDSMPLPLGRGRAPSSAAPQTAAVTAVAICESVQECRAKTMQAWLFAVDRSSWKVILSRPRSRG